MFWAVFSEAGLRNDVDGEIPNIRNEAIESALLHFKEQPSCDPILRISLPFKGLRAEEVDYVLKALVWSLKTVGPAHVSVHFKSSDRRSTYWCIQVYLFSYIRPWLTPFLYILIDSGATPAVRGNL
jgi:hypothetical protein